jgi:hypothetical protein
MPRYDDLWPQLLLNQTLVQECYDLCNQIGFERRHLARSSPFFCDLLDALLGDTNRSSLSIDAFWNTTAWQIHGNLAETSEMDQVKEVVRRGRPAFLANAGAMTHDDKAVNLLVLGTLGFFLAGYGDARWKLGLIRTPG